MATPEKARELQAKLAAGGFGYGDAKKELLATLTDYFAPFRKKREELVKNLDYVHETLRKGAERANVVANETMRTCAQSRRAPMKTEVLQHLAGKVGTPFWVYDAALLRQRIGAIKVLTESEGLQARYAMKACSATRILKEMLEAGIWIDAVSGNEVLRARRAGFPGSSILYTSDVFRDGAIAVLREHGVMPNLGSPGMLSELRDAGYDGPISLRVNPGFGHGHVNECDTGGPSSKHGIWFSDVGGRGETGEEIRA